MTDPQKRFYWRLWADVCTANEWRTRKGRFEHDPERLNEMGRQVWPIAERLAAAEHRALTLDDLRHAACALAIGSPKSHKSLSNAEFNRVMTCFKLLIDYENLDALMDWQNSENAERRSFIAFLLKKAPEATLIAISRNAFGTQHWQELPLPKLRWLSGKLKDRREQWNRLVPSPAHPPTCPPAHREEVNESAGKQVGRHELDASNTPF